MPVNSLILKLLIYDAIESYFVSTEGLVDRSEGIAKYYDPSCHEQLATDIQHAVPYRGHGRFESREFGYDYIFHAELLQQRD